MYKKNFNCYIYPTKLSPYIRAILVRCWYWKTSFPEVYIEGFTEMNSNVPKDIYEKVLEEAKKNYLADTGDDTFDDWENKRNIIDNYIYGHNNFSLEDSPKYNHLCPKKLVSFVEDILTRCWYSFEIIEEGDKDISFRSNLREHALPFVIERAKMELWSSLHDNCIYVSPEEEGNRNGWLTYMMHGYWHTNFYFMVSMDDMDEIERLI